MVTPETCKSVQWRDSKGAAEGRSVHEAVLLIEALRTELNIRKALGPRIWTSSLEVGKNLLLACGSVVIQFTVPGDTKGGSRKG